MAVIESVAEHDGVDPLDLPPLYNVIDPDALDALFADNEDSNHTLKGQVTFEFNGYAIQVDSNGEVNISG